MFYFHTVVYTRKSPMYSGHLQVHLSPDERSLLCGREHYFMYG